MLKFTNYGFCEDLVVKSIETIVNAKTYTFIFPNISVMVVADVVNFNFKNELTSYLKHVFLFICLNILYFPKDIVLKCLHNNVFLRTVCTYH